MGELLVDAELERLAIFVHSVLATFHCLGIVYNVRRKNWWDVAAHTLAACYDTQAALHHKKKILKGEV